MKLYQEEFRTFRGYALARNQKSLTPGMEDYLEMIYRLSARGEAVRVNTLARALNVKPPSVTSMVQRLQRRSLIHCQKYGHISLSLQGYQIGSFLLKRHHMLETFLQAIGVKEQLLENVERIEHNLTGEATECLSLLVQYIEENPDWFQPFQEYCAQQRYERESP